MKNWGTNEGQPIPKKLPSGFSFDFKACRYATSQGELKNHKVKSKNRNCDKKKGTNLLDKRKPLISDPESTFQQMIEYLCSNTDKQITNKLKELMDSFLK